MWRQQAARIGRRGNHESGQAAQAAREHQKVAILGNQAVRAAGLRKFEKRLVMAVTATWQGRHGHARNCSELAGKGTAGIEYAGVPGRSDGETPERVAQHARQFGQTKRIDHRPQFAGPQARAKPCHACIAKHQQIKPDIGVEHQDGRRRANRGGAGKHCGRRCQRQVLAKSRLSSAASGATGNGVSLAVKRSRSARITAVSIAARP